MQWQQFLRITLVLLSLNLSAENFGYLTHQLYQFLGIAALIFYALISFPFGRSTQQTGTFLLGVFLLLFSLFFFSGSILSRITGTGLFLFALGLLLKSKGEGLREIPLLLSTVTIYFLFFLFYLYSPPFWYALSTISLQFSGLIGTLTAVPMSCSSSFMGIPILVLFLTFILLSFFCSGRKKPFLFILSLISFLFLSGYYLALVELLPSLGKSVMKSFSDEHNFVRLFLGFLFEKDYPLPRNNYRMNAPLLLFLLCLIPLWLILWKRTTEGIFSRSGKGRVFATPVFLAAIVLLTAVLTVDLPGTPSPKKHVVLYNKGFLNWQVPGFSMFGSRSAGMFGNLPLFLAAMGFSTEKVDNISPEVLQDAQILMMINVDREVPREELQAIWNFVEGGGSLLLLGDHTFYKHGVKRIILNDILEPYSIRYNFDSADWFIGGWLHSYRYASHPVTVGMRDDMNDAGIVIGASLSAPPPAFPLVTGKYGYSDPGNEMDGGQRGYLGNLNYDQGEPLGDIVLCAAQHHGRGKVMVFGDTSSFANAILVNSHDFVNRVFTWLAREESPRQYRRALLISLLLLLPGLFFFLQGSQKPYLLVLSLVAALSVVWCAEKIKGINNQRGLQGAIAYVDASHGERFSPESWNENAVMGLYLNLMRNGYLPLTLRRFEESRLKEADLLVLIAPSAPFTGKEIGWIRDFVSGGGILMLSAGWEEREASLTLMDTFGFALEHLPLAQFISVIPRANQRVRFAEAWPVISTGEQSEVIAAYQTYPVIVKRAYGDGTVVMIGDSSFFWNKNLEMEESHIRENIEFLRWLFKGVAS